MKADPFRRELRARLQQHSSEVLLRILVAGDRSVELTGGDILRESLRLASLATAPAGRVVLLLLPHSVELFLLHVGLVLTKRIPAILPWPTRRVNPEKYQRNLLHQLRHLPAEELITTPRLASGLGSRLPYPVVACGIEDARAQEEVVSMSLRLCGEDGPPAAHTPFQDPGEALFLQFSGGTTGLQKSVVITAPILTSQLGSLRESLRFSSADVVVSWLPLYHDMGLIACLWLPLWHAASSVQLAAQDWLLDAGLLFRSLERHRGTFCWLPNFAFSYLAAQRHRMAGPYSLAHVRAYIDCSEPVRLRSIREFAAAFADWGVNPQQVQASYAMAENVFAATQTQLGRKPSTIPRTALRKAEDPASPAFALADEVFVSSGRPIGGVQVRIVTPQGQACAEREPGEIQLATESLFSGYWGSQGFTTNTFTRDRWYATGDYGFLADGELYVIGRLRDIVIAGGQNIFPEDVEDIVSAVPGVYAGRTVAFGIANAYDTESLIVVAEMKGAYDTDRAAVLEKEIAGILLTAVGIAPERVWVVPERWILKSTAGKISRRETRERYLRERAQKPQSRVAVVGADR